MKAKKMVPVALWVGALVAFLTVTSYAAPARIPKTGQTASYGQGDDGALQMGVKCPTLRFKDNNNGTVTDKLTGRIWMKDMDFFGAVTWDQALSDANNLQSGMAGLTDKSKAGDWRLPNLRELQSLVDYGKYNPCLPPGHPFINVTAYPYWSSTSLVWAPSEAWSVYFSDGLALYQGKDNTFHVWCVRGSP